MEELSARESLDCGGCLNQIGQDEFITALGQDWHRDCFRCSACDALLSTWYFEKAGLLFCQADYWARFGEPCHQCSQVITGPVMSAGRHRFHPECFACRACAAPIEDGEPYALRDRSELYCGSCYSPSPPRPAPRAVPAPAHALTLAPDADGALHLTNVDSSCGLALSVGDRVLEINGAPALQQLQLLASDAVLQLTIEHNPDPPTDRADDKCKSERSPVERRMLKEERRQNMPSEETKPAETVRKERLFKRRGGAGAGGERRGGAGGERRRPRVHDRSASMPKLDDTDDADSAPSPGGVMEDLARARSFRAHPSTGQTVFRATDLLQGELLGSGFFGQVYKVTHRATGELMVLKQLYRVTEDAQRNFLKEVAVLRSLEHPNVLRFIGVLYKEKRLHLVTEYVAGGTLHDLLQDMSVELCWAERARLARDVCRGLAYLHRMDVIHRDLNSHNCLVREDKTVIVADFGLARIVRRTAGGGCGNSLRRKRYTVVGNPYWMAPEMMNGDEYDERVDVFSFGIILCEIIGRVSADPDFLPRRSDFGLNEALFRDTFCADPPCPEPFYRTAFRACHLDPDRRPPCEVLEKWLEQLVSGLTAGEACVELGRAVEAWARDDTRPQPEKRPVGSGVAKSISTASVSPPRRVSLGKCVSASQLSPRPLPLPRPLPASRSERALAPGYIIRARGDNIDITKVDDVAEWLDPLPLKRTSPDSNLHRAPDKTKTRKVLPPYPPDTPAFLRNQSVEGLETENKHEVDHPVPICRHISIPDHCQMQRQIPQVVVDSDTSDSEEEDMCKWYKNVSAFKKLEMDVDQPKTKLAKKDEAKKTDVILRNPDCLKGERKLPEVDSRRFNIDHLTKNKMMAEGVKNIPKTVEVQKPVEKSNFFKKKLLSPKLSRLFKPNTSEVVRSKEEDEKSRSKFFVQPPASPNIYRASYKIRPIDDKPDNVIKTDIKLASMGKPMTPIFRRHIPNEKHDFADGRFSYRDRRPKYDFKTQEPKFVDIGRNRIKAPINVVEKTKLAPLIRSTHTNNIPALTTVPEKKFDKEVKPRPGISRSNYVSLANLKINSKKDLEKVSDEERKKMNETSPVERVI